MIVVLSLDRFEIYSTTLGHLTGHTYPVGDLVSYFLSYHLYSDCNYGSFADCYVDDVRMQLNHSDKITALVCDFYADFTQTMESVFNRPIVTIIKQLGYIHHTIIGDALIISNDRQPIDIEYFKLIKSQANEQCK